MQGTLSIRGFVNRLHSLAPLPWESQSGQWPEKTGNDDFGALLTSR